MEIITITGTKGKTTVTRALAHIIHESGRNTLRVDTDGHYINEKQKSDLNFSKEIFNTVPPVSPGKYLIEMKNYLPNFTAILEASLGSSASPGIGYSSHKVGIFTNVYEDHIGVTGRLKNKRDIAQAKRFIFKRIGDNGYAVFNADDRYVCGELKYIPKVRNVNLIPFGYDFKYFDLKKHLKKGGVAITEKDGYIVLISKGNERKILKTADISWTFMGFYKSSILNIMAIVGGLYGCKNGRISSSLIKTLKKYKLDQDGGRLTLLEGRNNIKVIVDFAHEKFSLREIGKLGKKMAKGKTIGVLRLAPDRTDKMIYETGQFIANNFSDIIIYDKIDGIVRDKYIGKLQKIKRYVGDVSSIFYEGVKNKKRFGILERIIVEEEAVIRASELAKPGDVVIVICGDDHKRTIGYVKKYFNAKLA